MTAVPSDILERLPHRAPFLFLTRIDELVPGARGRAVWSVTGREPFLAGHFPGRPLVPGVLLGEALAQLSGLVAAGAESRGPGGPGGPWGAGGEGALAQIDLRFVRAVPPPAEVRLASRVQRSLGRLWRFDVEATVDRGPVAAGSLTLALRGEPEG